MKTVVYVLLCQQVKIKTESKEEEKSFFQEISRFNSDFSLQQNRETDIERQTRSEMLELEQEEESLNKGCKTLFIVLLSPDD